MPVPGPIAMMGVELWAGGSNVPGWMRTGMRVPCSRRASHEEAMPSRGFCMRVLYLTTATSSCSVSGYVVGSLARLYCRARIKGKSSIANDGGIFTLLNSASTSAIVRRTLWAYSYMSSVPSPGCKNSTSFSCSRWSGGEKCRIKSKKERRGTEKGSRCTVRRRRSVSEPCCMSCHIAGGHGRCGSFWVRRSILSATDAQPSRWSRASTSSGLFSGTRHTTSPARYEGAVALSRAKSIHRTSWKWS